MTEERKIEMCREYANCTKNIFGDKAFLKAQALSAEAAEAGLKFNMKNYSQWVLPYALVDPVFELIEI